MPGRNITKYFEPHTFYHLYNRGVNKRVIFQDSDDYAFFTQLLARHLSKVPAKDGKGREYPHLRPQLDLVAYCLMPNHFHFLVYQKDYDQAISKLMLSVGTAYTMYFNGKYKRRGPLFENHYRASGIYDDAYLQHITRYIHLNPADHKKWPYSSFSDYQNNTLEWLTPEPIFELFDSKDQYFEFINDYEDAQRALDIIKQELW